MSYFLVVNGLCIGDLSGAIVVRKTRGRSNHVASCPFRTLFSLTKNALLYSLSTTSLLQFFAMATSFVTTTTIQEIEEHDGDLEEEIDIYADAPSLPVTFIPQLFLQRRIWILDILRRESIVDVLDVGCGEGQLLSVLAQPAPWLPPPPPSLLPSNLNIVYQPEVPDLHPRRIVGLDIDENELLFAAKGIQPPDPRDGEFSKFTAPLTRWQDLNAKVWKGGLEVFNQDFVGVECIVCTEVIEHLPPDVFPALAPMLLGVYHPKRLLLTTPSYTFNDRFTRPGSSRATRARQAFEDPTGRTDRLFRHSDHKFEWTVAEFETWCRASAVEWGYELEEMGGVGQPCEEDPWGREKELGYASLVVSFKRADDDEVKLADKAGQARAVLESLNLPQGPAHSVVAEHEHRAHERSGRLPTPQSIHTIGELVKSKMEYSREALVNLEQMWLLEPELAKLCGGWLEVLIWAVEAHEELSLLRGEGTLDWAIELVGGLTESPVLWNEADTSVDLIPPGWIPGHDLDEPMESDSFSSTGADDGDDDSWDGSVTEDRGDENDAISILAAHEDDEENEVPPWGNTEEVWGKTEGGWGDAV
ncbi:unnamed protein product [Mycena citricolor]|uniref:Small RNA 2'-O-methyltransferase n=1 Tax=Mycena citricolor TaxID=2018698 RepID=A0AAD2Q2S0_9AGAR|nr:unnamed protein product [Mycena citricolor]